MLQDEFLSYYSQRPHNALVMFIGKAALQLQGAACRHDLPHHAWGVHLASALAPLDENGVD
jgi:hypothetical protein